MKHGQVEILAPAGSFESMKAAIAAGADAVYIGGSRFGARAYANNLEEKLMLEAIDYAHLQGVSLYLTVNTLMKEKELEELYSFLKPYYEQGLDGVIVQDLGAVSYIRQQFPDLAIHASTQMTITGIYGARLLSKLGITRLVAARELSLEELRRIHEEVPIEIEAFVHGALCYCYSGQCLLSSFIGGRSGNRGRCAQPCRLPYTVESRAGQEAGKRFKKGKQQEEAYLLSMKDLCTLELIPQLLEAGVSSLKIEGRMKSSRYTAGVVQTYRKYVNLYLQKGRDSYKVDSRDKELLLDLFDRGGFTEGYYQQHNGANMVVQKEKPAFRPGNQELFDKLDRLYINTEKKISISGILSVKGGLEAKLQLWPLKDNDIHNLMITVYGQMVQTAKSQPATKEQLARQIKKTGNTLFEFQNLEIDLEGEVFLPVKALNDLRREGLEKLKEAMLNPYQRKETNQLQESLESIKEISWQQKERDELQQPELHALLSGTEGFSSILFIPEISEIMIEADEVKPELWKDCVKQCHEVGKRCVLAMPVIFRNKAEQYFDKCLSLLVEARFDGILVRALEEIQYLKDRGMTFPIYGDHNLYSFNHMAQEMMMKLGCERITFPLELNSQELRTLEGRRSELIVYGFLPAMVSAQCIQKQANSKGQGLDRCFGIPDWLMLKDRTGKELPVRNHCTYCYNIIYNPDVLSLLGQKERIRKLSPQAVRLQFTRESDLEMKEVVNAWIEELYGGTSKTNRNLQQKDQSNQILKIKEIPSSKGTALAQDFTKGHFRRGVE